MVSSWVRFGWPQPTAAGTVATSAGRPRSAGRSAEGGSASPGRSAVPAQARGLYREPMEQPAVVTEQRAPWWRTALWWALCVLASLTTLAYALPDPAYGWQMLVVLAGFAVAFALPSRLAWRARHPYTVTLVASGAAVLLPVGGWGGRVGRGSVLGRRGGSGAGWAAGAAAAATAARVGRDVRRPFTGRSVIGGGPAPADAGPQAQATGSWCRVPV